MTLANESGAKQRAAILSRLKRGPLTSIDARERMGILAPATRIFELRVQGHQIDTRLCLFNDAQGRRHKVAEYTLRGVAK